MSIGLRERKKTEVRAQLTNSAFELISANGFERTTVAEIAAHAGVSPATFFRYFGSKEEVLFGDAPDRLRLLQRYLREADPVLEPLSASREAFVRLGASLARDPEVLSRLRVVLGHPDLRAKLEETMAGWSDVLADGFAERASSSEAAAVTARVVVAIFRASLTLWAAGGASLPQLVARGFDQVAAPLRLA